MPSVKANLTRVNYSPGRNGHQWIVVHNVGTPAQGEGAAYANTQYFKNTIRNASAHYFIDDGPTVWQCVGEDDRSWSIGDSWSRNGATNANSINIEVCGDWQFTANEIANLTWLVQDLMHRYEIDADHVVRHHDCTTKNCPAYYSEYDSAWRELHEQITNGADMITDEDIYKIAHAVSTYDITDKLILDDSSYASIGNCVYWSEQMLESQRAEIAALSEAVKVLAGAQGADPDAIAAAVAEAVEKKLEGINLEVTVD